jgi:hypothetical protein
MPRRRAARVVRRTAVGRWRREVRLIGEVEFTVIYR